MAIEGVNPFSVYSPLNASLSYAAPPPTKTSTECIALGNENCVSDIADFGIKSMPSKIDNFMKLLLKK